MIQKKLMPVKFYKTEAGKEPVRIWLKSLNKKERKIIGEDIKTVLLVMGVVIVAVAVVVGSIYYTNMGT